MIYESDFSLSLSHTHTISSSLPENGISHNSLVVLLNTVKTSNTIKELK